MNRKPPHSLTAVEHLPAFAALTPIPAGTGNPIHEAPADPLMLLNVSRFKGRFHALYTALALALAASAATACGISFGHWFAPAHPWSTWQPPRDGVNMTASAIAHHLAETYRFGEPGRELVHVHVQVPPAATIGNRAVSISTLLIQPRAGRGTGIQTLDTNATVLYSLCGRGPACSIASNQTSPALDTLLRREALELALMTLRYIPSVNTVLAVLPPPIDQSQGPALLFRKPALSKQLNTPLTTTLPAARPPLPGSPDRAEAETIDRLTSSDRYRYQAIQLPLGDLALALTPLPTEPRSATPTSRARGQV